MNHRNQNDFFPYGNINGQNYNKEQEDNFNNNWRQHSIQPQNFGSWVENNHQADNPMGGNYRSSYIHSQGVRNGQNYRNTSFRSNYAGRPSAEDGYGNYRAPGRNYGGNGYQFFMNEDSDNNYRNNFSDRAQEIMRQGRNSAEDAYRNGWNQVNHWNSFGPAENIYGNNESDLRNNRNFERFYNSNYDGNDNHLNCYPNNYGGSTNRPNEYSGNYGRDNKGYNAENRFEWDPRNQFRNNFNRNSRNY